MNKLLVDTNIVLDLLERRENFYREAQELFTLADSRRVALFVSALTFANTHYLLAKQLGNRAARKVLLKLKVLVRTLPLDDKILALALASEFGDFEDAIQYYSAAEHGLDFIITRNQKDFKAAALPVLTAREYLNLHMPENC